MSQVFVGRTEDVEVVQPDGSVVTHLANGLSMEERAECRALEHIGTDLTPEQAGRLLALYRVLADFKKAKAQARAHPSLVEMLRPLDSAALFSDGLRALSMQEDGGVPRWANDATLVFADCLRAHDIRRRDFNHTAPTPANPDITWPAGPTTATELAHDRIDSTRNLHRWLWWMRHGFLPDPWTPEDDRLADERAQKRREETLLAQAERARLYAQNRLDAERERLRVSQQSRNFNRSAARGRALDAGAWECRHPRQKQPGKRAVPCRYLNAALSLTCDVCHTPRPEDR